MDMDAFCVVLVSPLYGGNVGAVCRAMANMDVSDLRLVQPRVTDWDDAERMACHAAGILERRGTFACLADAVADCIVSAGTTARGGLYRQHVRSPREWAPALVNRTSEGRIALVFGPEDQGLSNDDVARCTHLIRIPTGSAYTSLNLAQAVMICLYECFQAHGSYTPPTEKSEAAKLEQRERMTDMWRTLLLRAGFMDTENADHMMQGIRRVFARGALSADDVNILMGVARQADWAIDHLNAGNHRARQAAAPGSEFPDDAT